MARSLQRRVSAPLHEPQSPFARTCQAAILISRAATHVVAARTAGRVDIGEAAALAETFTELLALVDNDVTAASPGSDVALALQVPRSLVWSGIVMLLDTYSCPENMRDLDTGGSAQVFKTAEELAMQAQSIDGLTKVSQRVRHFALEICHDDDVARVSPLVLDSLYGSMSVFHWLWKEGGNTEIERGLDDTQRALAHLTARWRVAGEYLAFERYGSLAAYTTPRTT